MAKGDNPIIPLYEPGSRITGAATAAITSGRFVKPADFQGGPLLDLSTPTSPLTKGNMLKVTQCGAGEKAIGVAGWDAPSADDELPVINGPGIVVPMVAGGTIAAGAKVMSDANGQPVAWTSAASEANNANGIALNAVTVGQTVYVRLYT
jgi:Uncharacterized conserved protein (DUF2190)